MNRQATQFWVSIIGIVALGIITGVAVVGAMFYDAPSDMAFLLVGGLLAVTSAASAYLFRLNGKS